MTARIPCVVGIGETAYTRVGAPDARSEAALAIEAIERAASDAGLETRAIDGLASFADSRLDPALLQIELLMPELRFSSMVWGGRGGGACGALAHAAMAVQTGQAECIAVFRSLSQTHTRRYGQFFGERTHRNFTATAGLFSPPQMNALVLQRYLWERNETDEAFGIVARICRDNAQHNPRAMLRGRPLDEAAWRSSPMIADPLRRADCCLENDGACAVLVTTLERARDLRRRPARILAAAQGSGSHWGSGAMGAHNMPVDRYTSGNGRELGKRLFAMAGVTPQDVDVAQLYDHFSGMVLIALEDYGFAPVGEGAALAKSGALSRDGRLPINPAGGNLAEAYVHGMNLVAEAARQVRGDASLPVPDARVSFVCSGGGVAPTSAALLAPA